MIIDKWNRDCSKLTVSGIRANIPQRLFVKDMRRFLLQVLRSVILCIGGIILGINFIPMELTIFNFFIWTIFAIVQGTLMIGVWVLGHECGHQAFSDKYYWNDLLGYILHTILLVPYFSWQHSHAVHHRRTNHIDMGETHVPKKDKSDKSDKSDKQHINIASRIYNLVYFFIRLFFGWYMYLLIGTTGGPARGFTSHFLVPNELFSIKRPLLLAKVLISNLGLFGVGYLLYLLSNTYGGLTIFVLYIYPYLISNMWLVFYTLMQHTDKKVLHYGGDKWNWLKGALLTIDRPYHPIINWLHYDIGHTHVCHHLFHELPSYHSVEATIYIRSYLKDIGMDDLYNYNDRNLLDEINDVAEKCNYVHEVYEDVWSF